MEGRVEFKRPLLAYSPPAKIRTGISQDSKYEKTVGANLSDVFGR